MDFRVNKESVPTSECIFSGVQEQGLEVDYILPDYYPDIFRLVRCELTPTITGYSVMGDKLSYELRCDIRILYCSADGSMIQCVEQRKNFTKTADLSKLSDITDVSLVPKTDHVNFRAVNKRRLDMRGAVSVKICVMRGASQEIVSDASGMNIQLRKAPVEFPIKKLSAEKNVQLSENIELIPSQPDAVNIITIRTKAGECEKKLISGKMLVKGDIDIYLLYSCETSDESACEPMNFTLSYSQIVDIDGIDDTFDCSVTPEIISCEITPAGDKNGDNRILKCEAEIRLVCKAAKTSSVVLVTDAYSTIYPCEVVFSDITAEQTPMKHTESFRHSAVIASGENVPQTVYSMWCTPKNINTRFDDDGKTVIVSGMLTYSMAAKDISGTIVMPDRDEAFEQMIEIDGIGEDCTITADITIKEVSYNISSDGELMVKSDIIAEVNASSCNTVRAVTDISVDESTKKQRDGDYAIKLYYGVQNENVWDIAKRYSTDVDAVMEENELEGEILESGSMLLIPIVS